MAKNPVSLDPTVAVLGDLVRALDEKKVEDIRVLHVSEQSSITDYLVLATGNSEPHLRALRIAVEKVLDEKKIAIAGMDTGDFNSGWTVVDAYQIMVHLFTPERRETYALEKLWKDADELSVPALLKPETVVTRVSRVAAKKKVAPEKKAAPAKKAPAKKVTGKAVAAPKAKKVTSAAKKPAKKVAKKATPSKKAAK